MTPDEKKKRDDLWEKELQARQDFDEASRTPTRPFQPGKAGKRPTGKAEEGPTGLPPEPKFILNEAQEDLYNDWEREVSGKSRGPDAYDPSRDPLTGRLLPDQAIPSARKGERHKAWMKMPKDRQRKELDDLFKQRGIFKTPEGESVAGHLVRTFADMVGIDLRVPASEEPFFGTSAPAHGGKAEERWKSLRMGKKALDLLGEYTSPTKRQNVEAPLGVLNKVLEDLGGEPFTNVEKGLGTSLFLQKLDADSYESVLGDLRADLKRLSVEVGEVPQESLDDLLEQSKNLVDEKTLDQLRKAVNAYRTEGAGGPSRGFLTPAQRETRKAERWDRENPWAREGS